MPQKTSGAISESLERCSRRIRVWAEIEHLIAEARQAIDASKAVIDRLDLSGGTNRNILAVYDRR
jgi:hypothetical protein